MTSEILTQKMQQNQMDDKEIAFFRASDLLSSGDKRTNSLHMDNSAFLNLLMKEMQEACDGLKRLKNTYSDDHLTTARMDILIQSFERQISNINNFLPKDENNTNHQSGSVCH